MTTPDTDANPLARHLADALLKHAAEGGVADQTVLSAVAHRLNNDPQADFQIKRVKGKIEVLCGKIKYSVPFKRKSP